MHTVPAHINHEGIETVYTLAEHPSRLDSHLGSLTMGFAGVDQFYIPGISVPGHAQLEKPFYVPVIGDAEPLSLVIDTAHMDTTYVKRVTFVGKLIAESIAIKSPVRDREPFLDDENPAALAIDEAFDELCGEGGFLRVTAISAYDTERHVSEPLPLHGIADYDVPSLSLSGKAELYLFDDLDEFEHIEELLLNGSITPIDILAHSRAARLNDLLQKKSR